jgi:uncharacterized protein YlxW (UPF0749 family)
MSTDPGAGMSTDPGTGRGTGRDDVHTVGATTSGGATPTDDRPPAAAAAEHRSPTAAGAVPAEAVPAEAVPGEAVPGEAVPGEAVPGTSEQPAPEQRRLRGRDPLAAVLIGVLTLLLGFAFAVQVRSTGTDQQLAGAREEDLVRILDDLSAQQDRLRQEIADQRTALDQLGSSDSAAAAALAEARERAEALGILNGSIAAQGPGMTMTIRDPEGRISSSVVLTAIQELRGAGAETMQVDDVRVGVSSAVTGTPGRLAIDGFGLEAPYTFEVIGSPQDMATAMSIPGGVVSTVGGRGGSVEIVQSEQVVVDALRPLDVPQYAEPGEGD